MKLIEMITTWKDAQDWLNTLKTSQRNYYFQDGKLYNSGSVYMPYNNIHKLPVQFGKVFGDFNLSGNSITSLEGFPFMIGGSLILKDCIHLKSLKGIHKTIKKIGGMIDLTHTPIESNILGLLLIDGLSSIEFTSAIHSDRNKALAILNRQLGGLKGKKGVLEAQEKLLEEGLDEYAEL